MSLLIDDPAAPVAPALAAVSDRLVELSGVELWRLDDDQTTAAVGAAYALVTQAHTVALTLLAEADRRDLAGQTGAPSTPAWLQATRRVRPQTAKRDVELARLVARAADLDPARLRAGLLAGQVNVEQAGCVATALAELPADAAAPTRVLAERLLVHECDAHGPQTLTRLGHRILDVVDPDAADVKLAKRLEREEREARRLRAATRFADGHGSVFYRLRVSLADDAVIFPVLDALGAPDPAGPAGRDTRTAQQRRADAFVEAFRRVSLDGGLPQSGGDRPRVLVGGLDTLIDNVGAATMVDTGDELSPAAARRLACDAQLIPAVLAGQGAVLDIGRARRTFDGPIRTAVIARDHGCVHPGCDRPARWCDVHHVIAWWKGGRTSLHNGVTLCGFHHRLYDDETWRIRFAADHIPESIPPTWVDPQHKPIRHPRFLARRRLPH